VSLIDPDTPLVGPAARPEKKNWTTPKNLENLGFGGSICHRVLVRNVTVQYGTPNMHYLPSTREDPSIQKISPEVAVQEKFRSDFPPQNLQGKKYL